MEMNSASVEAVVKQVLESMLEGKSAVKSTCSCKSKHRKQWNSKDSTCSNADSSGKL